MQCGSGGCQCATDLIRDETTGLSYFLFFPVERRWIYTNWGECVPAQKCPNKCASNEVYDRCFHGCEATCDQPNPVRTSTKIIFDSPWNVSPDMHWTVWTGRMSMHKWLRERYKYEEMCAIVCMSTINQLTWQKGDNLQFYRTSFCFLFHIILPDNIFFHE